MGRGGCMQLGRWATAGERLGIAGAALRAPHAGGKAHRFSRPSRIKNLGAWGFMHAPHSSHTSLPVSLPVSRCKKRGEKGEKAT